MNYFEFYQIPVSFQVDEAALRRIFYQNSKKYHPDFHTLSDEAQQADMLEMSTLNNEAFKVLSDPDQRMRYILELNDMMGEEGSNKLPQDFLMDMMDINEALMELEMDFDPERYQTALLAVENIENELQKDIAPRLAAYSPEQGKEGLAPVRDFFLKKRYLLRIRKNLSNFAPA